MGCWGTGIAANDEFWDVFSNLHKELHWNQYDGREETIITPEHFNSKYELIANRIQSGFTKNYETCWFQVVAYLVMEIGGKMSREMRDNCKLACRIENDYLDPGAWLSEKDLSERRQALEQFALKIDDYYCSKYQGNNYLEKDY